MRPSLISLTLAVLVAVPAGNAMAQDGRAEGEVPLPLAEMREALRNRSDRELDFLSRSTAAEVRETAARIEELQRAADEPAVLLVDTRAGVQTLDLDELDILLPVYPLYALGTLRAQVALQRVLPALVALHRAAQEGLISPTELLAFTPEERRSRLSWAVSEQRRSQVELARSALADERRSLADLETLGGLLEEVIAERASPEQASEPTSAPPDEQPAQASPLPAQTGFEGVWSSTYGRELVLTQSGNVVTGTYDEEDGRVSFEVTGENTLEGIWAEDDSQEACDDSRLGTDHWGRIALVFTEDRTSYDGLWGYCDDPLPEEFYGYWNGSYIGPGGRDEDGQ